MIYSFKNWLLIEENSVRSYRKANPKNPEQYFIVLYGNTFAIKDDLKKMGFWYFRGTWSILENKLTEDLKVKLINLGVDLSGSEEVDASVLPAQPEQEDSKIDHTLQTIKQNVDSLLKSEDGAKAKGLVEYIDKMIERIADSTDEAAKQEFITNFLKFSSKFHNYSLANQMLIWAQTKGKAEHISSATNWTKLGRTINDWSKGILIFAPITVNKKPKTPFEVAKPEKVTRFKAVKVYDISATIPIPGHPSPFQPTSRKDWSIDSNEDIEELNVLINSLTKWIKEKNINVNFEELSDELGGYSAGGKIAINDKFKGINLFSTLVHETVHELLHWLDKKLSREESKQQKEIDAETTAYVVCHHFGFETKDTPNYLALWRAKGENIKERKQNIHKASKIIIQAIEEKVTETDLGPEEEIEENYSFSNWLKTKRLIN
jgi:hypothetical protein